MTGSQMEDALPNPRPWQGIVQGHHAASSFQHKPDQQEQQRMDDARFWLAAISDSSDDAIIGKNLDGVVTSWNKAAETMFGFTEREIVGRSITLIIPADRIEEEASILSRLANGEKIDHFET